MQSIVTVCLKKGEKSEYMSDIIKSGWHIYRFLIIFLVYP